VHKNSKIRGIHMHYVRCGRSGGFAHIYLCINHVAKFLCLSLARRLSISRGVSYKRGALSHPLAAPGFMTPVQGYFSGSSFLAKRVHEYL